jgi:hypothetical protein
VERLKKLKSKVMANVNPRKIFGFVEEIEELEGKNCADLH